MWLYEHHTKLNAYTFQFNGKKVTLQPIEDIPTPKAGDGTNLLLSPLFEEKSKEFIIVCIGRKKGATRSRE